MPVTVGFGFMKWLVMALVKHLVAGESLCRAIFALIVL